MSAALQLTEPLRHLGQHRERALDFLLETARCLVPQTSQ